MAGRGPNRIGSNAISIASTVTSSVFLTSLTQRYPGHTCVLCNARTVMNAVHAKWYVWRAEGPLGFADGATDMQTHGRDDISGTVQMRVGNGSMILAFMSNTDRSKAGGRCHDRRPAWGGLTGVDGPDESK